MTGMWDSTRIGTARSRRVRRSVATLGLLSLVVIGLAGSVCADTVQLTTAETTGLQPNRTDCSHTELVRAIHVESYTTGDQGGQNVPDYRTYCSFDRDGRSLEQSRSWEGDRQVQRYVFAYDSKGHRTETDIFHSTIPRSPALVSSKPQMLRDGRSRVNRSMLTETWTVIIRTSSNSLAILFVKCSIQRRVRSIASRRGVMTPS